MPPGSPRCLPNRCLCERRALSQKNGRLLAQGERHFTRVSRPSTYEAVSLGNSDRAYRFNGFDHRVGHLWLVATQHDGGTFVHFFFRSLHDCRTIPTYFAGLSQMARGYIHYSLSWCTRGRVADARIKAGCEFSVTQALLLLAPGEATAAYESGVVRTMPRAPWHRLAQEARNRRGLWLGGSCGTARAASMLSPPPVSSERNGPNSH